MARRFWLLKSEPETFGLADLKRSRDRTTCWDGVRNYQARNLLRDQIQAGDLALFYHSSCDPPGVVGTVEVVRAGYPDPTQFRAGSKYHDPDSPRDAPRWYAVDVRFESEFPRQVSLAELRQTPGLSKMVLLNRSRLSVQPVTPAEWRIIEKLALA
jgi:predicted RNA-binding protein with PUA-like domain